MPRRTLLVIGAGVLVAVFCGFAYERIIAGGVAFPFRVSGSSMAPTLMPEHASLECDACGVSLKLDLTPANVADSRMPTSIVCHNCMATVELGASLQVVEADWVRIDKRALARRAPQRWEIIAARDPLDADRIVVKRVVGLPGDSLKMLGDVLQIVDSHGEQQSLARDDLKLPTSIAPWISVCRQPEFESRDVDGPSRRWHNVGSSSWSRKGRGFYVDAEAGTKEHQLSYRHEDAHQGTEPAVVYDDNPFNASVSRMLTPATTIRFAGVATLEGTGQLLLRCNVGNDHCNVVVDSAKRAWWIEGDEVAIHKVQADTIEFQLIVEESFGIRIDRDVVWVPRTSNSIGASKTPAGQARFVVGAKGLSASITRLRVDKLANVTLDSPRRSTDREWRLRDDEFFLLGDNAPVSIDSRHWPTPVRSNRFVGIVSRVSDPAATR